MRRIIIIFFLTSSIFNLLSQEDFDTCKTILQEKKVGDLLEKYISIHDCIQNISIMLFYSYHTDNNTLSASYSTLNDIEYGSYKMYYPNGKIRIEGNYDFNLNSLKDSIGYIKEQSRIDTCFYNGFDEGCIEGVTYKNPRQGEWKYYYENGNIAIIASFKYRNIFIDNKEIKDGLWKYFKSNGKLYKKEIYINDKLIKTEIIK